jgi:transcription elongation factor Elf1
MKINNQDTRLHIVRSGCASGGVQSVMYNLVPLRDGDIQKTVECPTCEHITICDVWYDKDKHAYFLDCPTHGLVRMEMRQ